jgi:hypothetical protein
MDGQVWLELYRVVTDLGRSHCRKRKQYADARIALVFLWSVLHDRPRCWACDPENWPEAERWQTLPSPRTLGRRLRTVGVQLLLEQAQGHLRDRLPASPLKLMDAKPLPVGGCTKDRDAKAGRGAGGRAKGYRLHAVLDGGASGGAVERGWRLAPMNANEKPVARESLLPALPAGTLYVAADNEYDGNDTYDAAAAAPLAPGAQLVTTPRRVRPKGLGHRRQSPRRLRSLALTDNPLAACGGGPSFGQLIVRARDGIERRFGLMGNFGGGLGPLPNWVRRPRRVALWVAGKILIYMARQVVKQRLAA